MKLKLLLFSVLSIFLFSFSGDKKLSFSYPNKKDAQITLTTDKFKKFSEEWRGEDYYYIDNKGKGGFICSVLFYKLNKQEVEDLEQIQKKSGVAKGNPIFPLEHFTSSSQTKKYESNQSTWSDATGDFMFSQTDIKEFSGTQINQKNMCAYTMFGEDLFVKVHLSKVLCTQEDSIAMRQILDGIKKVK
jgi:hypothetical protein